MDTIALKNIIILSLILGVILGFVSAVPYVGIVGIIILFILAAPIVMFYLIMDGKLDLTTVKDSIIHGAIIGFVTSLSYSVIYALITVIMDKAFHYTSNFFLTKMIENAPIFLFIIAICFLGVAYATTNAFGGFLTYYSINFIRDLYEKKHEGKNGRI